MKSSFSRNLSASCLRLSIEKIVTFWFGWEPTQMNYSESIAQILLHTKRILDMFKSAISTNFCSEKILVL